MDFEAEVRIRRTNPEHASKCFVKFEAADWDEAQDMCPTLALPHGYSAYQVDSVISLERLL